MKVKKIKETKIIDFVIDYENGVICEYTTKNNRLTDFSFLKDKKRYFVIDNIDEVTESMWYNFHKIMDIRKITKISDLKNFEDFDKLYSRRTETLLYDINDKVQKSILKLSESFFSIYCNVRRKEDVDAIKKRIEKVKEIINIEDVEIPYYNGGGVTLQAKIKLSAKTIEDIFIKFPKKDYIDEYMLMNIIENLIGDGEPLRVPEYEVEDEDDDNCHCICY